MASSAESDVARGREILLSRGPAEALKFLAASEQASSPEVRRAIWAIASVHFRRLGSLLEEETFDAIWSQCSVCDTTWMLSPMHAQARSGKSFGVTCAACGRVLCPPCAQASPEQCPCGGSYVPLVEPNGRRRHARSDDLPDEWARFPPDQPSETQPDLHLYFGFDGRIPVAIDTTLTPQRAAPLASHLAWAAMLAAAGLHHHAHQQLQVVDEPSDAVERAQWLYWQARIASVRLHNARERQKRRQGMGLSYEEWREIPARIKEQLDAAVAANPALGPAWLASADACLDRDFGIDAPRALECALRARELLGDTPAVRFALGRAFRACDRPAEAVEVLAYAPPGEPRIEEWRLELHVARLEARCAREPFDVDAHFTLGRWVQRRLQSEKAAALFKRLIEKRPDRGEGYCGMAWMAFLDYDRSEHERITTGYDLCRQALERDPNLGAAYEILGTLCWRAQYAHPPLDVPAGDPLTHYRRAIELDPTCDGALEQVAADHMENGRCAKALELLEQAMEHDTVISTVYAYAALLYQVMRRWEDQDKAQQRANELAPDRALSDDFKAKILKRCGFEF